MDRSLSLALMQFQHTVPRCGFLFIELVRYMLCSPYLWSHDFHQLWKLLSHRLFKYCLTSPFLSETFIQSTITFQSLLDFPFACLCAEICVISSDLPSSSLFVSLVVSNMLLNSFAEFSVSTVIIYISRSSILFFSRSDSSFLKIVPSYLITLIISSLFLWKF